MPLKRQLMPNSSSEILDRFRTRFGKDIDLSLRPAYQDLLTKLGDPQTRLPPVFHVAGTNGKGSTCAFLRAMLEAAGYKVHVYTSPYLVTFHECIRIAGHLITENELAEILNDCERLAPPGGVSYFEVSTAAAFVAFARHPADFTILETGLGGRLDATNVIHRSLATIITRLSYDHREYLGDTINQIAREKGGIMRPRIPCFVAEQPDALALQSLREVASTISSPLFIGGIDWKIKESEDGFRYMDMVRIYDLPRPALLGQHQYQNAGLAIAALGTLPKTMHDTAIRQGLKTVEWPARLQRMTEGDLVALIPAGAELWLDGGHNDSAGEVLAAQISRWCAEDDVQPKRLYVILGMLTTKHPAEFLAPFAKYIAHLRTVAIVDEPLSFLAPILAEEVQKLGIVKVEAAESVSAALVSLARQWEGSAPPRILICGSLYLAGAVLTL